MSAQIGLGGMGEVSRATDTNLKRQVAIKVLAAPRSPLNVLINWTPDASR
jgi:serine/threonine protein kinase